MKAVQLSYTKNNLMSIAHELFFEHGWKMPRGLVQSEARDPRNFTLAEWQQAKRNDKDPRVTKTALQDTWAISDTKNTFVHALEERGFRLARGDRRGFVAVDMQGEIYALPRWIGIMTNAVRARLGDETDLPSVADVGAQIADEMQKTSVRLKTELLGNVRTRNSEPRRRREAMVSRHRQARQQLTEKIECRQWDEARMRQSRFREGLKGLWDWVRGENERIQERNEAEAQTCDHRDREEMDAFNFAQLGETRLLVDLRVEIAREFAAGMVELREDRRATKT